MGEKKKLIWKHALSIARHIRRIGGHNVDVEKYAEKLKERVEFLLKFRPVLGHQEERPNPIFRRQDTRHHDRTIPSILSPTLQKDRSLVALEKVKKLKNRRRSNFR